MNKFYTNDTQFEIWNNELDAERFYDALIDAYDPYLDYDDEDEEEPQDYYDGREDIAMEAGLFGWDA